MPAVSRSPSHPIRQLFGRRFWIFNASAWLLLAVANTGAIGADLVRSGRPGAWTQTLLQYLVFYGPWFLLTPVVFWWVARYPLLREGWRHAWRYVLFGVIWLACYLPTEAALYSLMTRGSLAYFREAFRGIPLNAWVLDSVFLVTLFGVASAVDMTAAARRRERQAARLAVENSDLSARLAGVRLQMLRAQLEPHFLFNALNSITALIRSAEPETAVRSVGLLSELLRYATRAASRERVAVEEEVGFAEAYLGFQQLRYGDRLRCVLEVDEAAGAAEIPPLILQPLLENAIRHGVERLQEPSRVGLKVDRRDAQLVLTVSNRPTPDAAETPGLGIGLANLRERLEVVYASSYELRSASTAGGHQAELVLPFEAAA
ncbi:MAG: histidine kinase [Acidobacteriota bacterium]